MHNFKLKTYKFLFVTLMLLLNSCDYILTDHKSDSIYQTNRREKIANNKEVARILVATSNNVINVINTCQAIEASDTDTTIKQPIAQLKNAQLKIYDSIRTTSSEALITIPSKTYSYNIHTEIDSVVHPIVLKTISTNISSQKENLQRLKSYTQDQELLDWIDTLHELSNENLKLLSRIESSF